MAPSVDMKPSGPAVESLFDDDMDLDPVVDAKTLRAVAAFDDPWADLANPQVMLQFYRRLLPWKQLFLWLNQDHVPSRKFTNREFAFTLSNDAYLRYNSFQTAQDLQREVVRLNPSRFEIGPVYTARPRDRKTLNKAQFRPVSRELVFDIDMTDYDEIRTCCSDKSICRRCWRFISMAVKVLDACLRDDFGFEHLLWVYSGRRGIHCWVSDPVVLNMTDDERKVMVSYIDVVKGGAKQDKRVNLIRPLHPSLGRSLDILKTPFSATVLTDQDAFRDQEKWEKLLSACPDKELATRLATRWGENRLSSSEKWADLMRARAQGNEKDKRTRMLADFLEDTVMQYAYPRIDGEVSKHLNHLLKSPFVVHPGTGRVCVPLDPKKVDEFDPEKVPDVRDLLRELDRVEAEAKKKGETVDPSGPGWDKTVLKPYVELFERHVQGILKQTAATKRQTQDASMTF